METATVDRILGRAQLTHQDFREVELLGNDAFDYIKEILSDTPGPLAAINGLKLLIHLARQAAQDSSGPRLPEVFDAASRFVADPDPAVRAIAARMVVWSLDILRGLGRGADAVGGVARVLDVVRSSLSAGTQSVERELLEKVLAHLEVPS